MPFSTHDHNIYDKRFTEILKEGLGYESNRNTFTRNLFTTVKTTDKMTYSTSISSQKLLRRLGENQVALPKQINQGFEARIAWNRYGDAVEVTYESLKTDDHNAIREEAEETVTGVLMTEDYYTSSIFRQAMNTSYTIADGQPLISGSHPVRGQGGTQANTFTDTQLPLTYASLKLGVQAMNRQVNHSGELITHGKKLTILCGTDGDTFEKALRYAKTDKRPETNYNDINFYKYDGLEYDVVATPLLNLSVAQQIGETTTQYSDITADSEWYNRWFLIDMDMLKKMKILEMPILEGEVDGKMSLMKAIQTESLAEKRLLYHFFGYGVRAGIHTFAFGSKGDNSATNF